MGVIKQLRMKLSYSIDGLVETWHTEVSFRQWFLLVSLSDLMAVIFISSIFFLALIITLGFLLLAAELINTAVEAVVDLVSVDHCYLAKKAKDSASAMTLLTFLALAGNWFIVLIF